MQREEKVYWPPTGIPFQSHKSGDIYKRRHNFIRLLKVAWRQNDTPAYHLRYNHMKTLSLTFHLMGTRNTSSANKQRSLQTEPATQTLLRKRSFTLCYILLKYIFLSERLHGNSLALIPVFFPERKTVEYCDILGMTATFSNC